MFHENSLKSTYKIFYLPIYFVFKRSLSFCHIIQGHFLVGVHWLGVPFPKLKTFSRMFCVLPINYGLYEKTVLGIFVYLFIYEVTTIKVNFRSCKQCSQAETRLICERAIFLQNASIIFSSNIPLYIEKNPMEKLCKALEMELKTYTSVSPKSYLSHQAISNIL